MGAPLRLLPCTLRILLRALALACLPIVLDSQLWEQMLSLPAVFKHCDQFVHAFPDPLPGHSRALFSEHFPRFLSFKDIQARVQKLGGHVGRQVGFVVEQEEGDA